MNGVPIDPICSECKHDDDVRKLCHLSEDDKILFNDRKEPLTVREISPELDEYEAGKQVIREIIVTGPRGATYNIQEVSTGEMRVSKNSDMGPPYLSVVNLRKL